MQEAVAAHDWLWLRAHVPSPLYCGAKILNREFTFYPGRAYWPLALAVHCTFITHYYLFIYSILILYIYY